MTSADHISEVLPFETFLEYLRRQGFHIGVEHHLRVQQLLRRFAADCDPTELKTLLCPLIATNAEQQEFFHRTFDDYYPSLQATRMTDPGRSLTAGQSQGTPAPRLVRRWPYLTGTGVALVLLVALLTWKTQQLRKPASHLSPTAAKSAQSPERKQSPSRMLDQTHHVSSRVVRIPPSVSPWLAWYSDQRVALGWSGVIGPLLCWLFYEVYRFRRRRLLIRKAQGKVPPYSWSIRTNFAPAIYPPHDLAVVSRLLHRRYQGEAERLDVAATVEASIAAFGFPTFRYRKDSRLPEYLFLIDRAGFRDHQARLHEHLAAVLHGQGLYVSVYFYEGDPRVCWSGEGDECLSLEQLQRARSGYRLLLFGDGEHLLDAVTGRLAHWHGLVTAWPDCAVLTPEPPEEWGLREMTLATRFPLAPATLDGLAAMAAHFSRPDGLDSRAWLEEGASPGNGPTGEVDSLRRYLGPDAFQWLCACAVYPELQWSLTLRIGALPSLPAGLVREENLVKLLRLKWFRTGSMPDDLRRELIGRLDPKDQREVREAIIGLLESNPPPPDTFAASAHQFQIAYQRLWKNPKDRKARRDLKAALDNISPDELAQDYAYLDAAESVSQSPLQVLLPGRFRKLIFPAGASWLGMRSAARLSLLAVAILGALFFLRLGDHRVKAVMDHYSVDLSKGLGLSMADLGDRVRVSWSTDSPVLQNSRSGVLIVTDGHDLMTVELTPEQLRAGSVEYLATSPNLKFALSVTDEVQNTTSEQAGLQLARRPSAPTIATAQEQTGAIVTTQVPQPTAETQRPQEISAGSVDIKGQGSKTEIEKKLLSRYQLTKTTYDKTDIVTAGSVLVLQKDKLIMVPIDSTSNTCQNNYKDGRLTQSGACKEIYVFGRTTPGQEQPIPNRAFVTGEKFWVTKIEVRDAGKDSGIFFEFYTDAIQDVRYKGLLDIQLRKGLPSPDEALKLVAEVLTVDWAPTVAAEGPTVAPEAPVEIRVGETSDEVVAALGQPIKKAKVGTKEIYFYKDLKVTFVGGKVRDVQ